MTATETELDQVVLLADDGSPIGTAPRLTVHDADTALHQAFSLHLMDDDGRVLITRRALTKTTWPGVWTNSCCGHPRPGEAIEDAVRRRLDEELGVEVDDLRVVLPDFRYRAVDASGIVENEICPVFVGRVRGELAPDPAEVGEHAWVDWADLVAAVRATPGVYSPWSGWQVPLIDEVLRRPPSGDDVGTEAVTLHAVDDLLSTELKRVGELWTSLASPTRTGAGDGPGDLPGWLRTLLIGQGKRLRPRMCHWGFVATGGTVGTPEHDDVVRVAAALETLHLFALVHDDVMDQSLERRGRAAAHVVAADRHRQSDGRGDAGRFGENMAILLGDLAHSEADRLAHTLPEPLRDLWYELNLELILGQSADLMGAARRGTDLQHAEAVAALKSGAYTIGRPLQLGALAAGATAEQLDALDRFGHHLGRAFAWRDDVLGVWGDPDVTGKPAGDDLREGKPTILWMLAEERLAGAAAEALLRVGTASSLDGDVALLQRAMVDAGIRDEVEERITHEVARAEAALVGQPLNETGVAGLRGIAHTIAWRDA